MIEALIRTINLPKGSAKSQQVPATSLFKTEVAESLLYSAYGTTMDNKKREFGATFSKTEVSLQLTLKQKIQALASVGCV